MRAGLSRFHISRLQVSRFGLRLPPRFWRVLLSCVAVLALVAYPFFVYLGLAQFGPQVLALCLLVLSLVRAAMAFMQQLGRDVALFAGLIIFCLYVLVSGDEQALLLYPALMNVLVALLFLVSLRQTKTFIERLHALSGESAPPQAVKYMRGLTKFWAILLLVNSVFSAYTACCTPRSFWALYNGAVVYGVFGLVMVGEFLVRQRVKNHHARTMTDIQRNDAC